MVVIDKKRVDLLLEDRRRHLAAEVVEPSHTETDTCATNIRCAHEKLSQAQVFAYTSTRVLT